VALQPVDESIGALAADDDAWRSIENRNLAHRLAMSIAP
jgi:hypothetical protein